MTLALQNRTIDDFFRKVAEWAPLELLLYFNLAHSLSLLSRPRLLSKLGAVVEDPYLKQLISSLSATATIFPSAAGKELPLFKLAVAVVELVLHTLLDEVSN